MNTLNDFEIKQRKYMLPSQKRAENRPPILKAIPMRTMNLWQRPDFMLNRLLPLADQFFRYFEINEHIFVGIDTFIYYREGDRTKWLPPIIYIVLGASKFPQRRSFYTWSEGAAPSVVFEFLSDSTARQDRHEKSPVIFGGYRCSGILYPSTRSGETCGVSWMAAESFGGHR